MTINEVYGDWGITDGELEALLDKSLHPRAPEMFYEVACRLGTGTERRVLDVGCRDARHGCELARRFDFRVLGVDPVIHNITNARKVIAEAGLEGRVEVIEGRAEALPCASASADLIFCRDVLTHVADLGGAFRECARVLAPGGAMLVFQTFATELLEPAEAERLYAPLCVVPANMSPHHVEAAALAAGFTIEERDIVTSEWREHGEEVGARRTSAQLLRIARMRRGRDAIVAAIGPVAYAIELADCHWGVYQMLGKLCPRVYVLRAPS
jgi:ubiquinone/menaquinone biosynthesis C-methylase UbiE